ncbi:MAG: VCBS repeat-containing protein [Planctomycetota bacterium]|nr:VCBS repeat-containing protein [Planctomycetota bacterium]
MTQLHLVLLTLAQGAPEASAPPAAPRFVDATETHLPARGKVPCNSMDVESADLDGDGDLDLVVAQEFLANKVLRNEGGARYVVWEGLLPPLDPDLAKSGPPGHDSEDVSIADFDGDGRLDIVFVSEDDLKLGRHGVHEFYRGQEGGTFARIADLLPDTEADAIAHADWNRDGRLDVLLSGAGQDLLLTNDGRGGFIDETELRLPREAATAQDAEFVDLDGDKDLDIVLALEGGHALWIQDARGVFQDETKARLPVAGFVEARKVAAVDVDRDGDVDLYFAHVGWQGRDPQDRLYVNDGKGRFTDETMQRIGAESNTTADARFADLDGDGDLDLVRVNLGPLEILVNDGKGRFTDVSARALPAAIAGPGLGVEIADFDRDGVLDLYVAFLAGPRNDPNAFDRLLLGVKPGG